MRYGLAGGDRVQLHIDNGKKKAYTRDRRDWTKRFPVVGRPLFCQGR
jgi:ATP-dependent DNA ligase